MKTFSVVVPVYFNEPNLPDTVPQLLALLSRLATDYHGELIFVDDGSGDKSLEILLDFQCRHPDLIKIVKLTRNFGSMYAIQAGLTVATGDCIGMITSDLQDPPELFEQMLPHWQRGCKAIFAVRQDRDEPFLQKILANLYYAMIRRFAMRNYPNGGFDFFVIDRQVVSEINRIQEKNTNIMTLIYWLGFEPILIPYVRRRREKGRSHWTLAKKIKLLIDTFVAFTFLPIRILSVVGLLLALGSFLYGAFVFFYWLVFGISVMGWVPLMLVITFASGAQMSMLGVLGEYLWRTLDEVRRRPQFVIDRIYTNQEHA